MTDSLELILKYFPSLSEEQKEQFAQLGSLYKDWNQKINVISRKDIDSLYEHHILHSLGIAKFTTFVDGAKILDIGTGGGFPGIPLAILYPHCQFTLIDSIGKKIKVAQDVAAQCGLSNVQAVHRNAVEEKSTYDFVVSRAVMNTSDLVKLIRKNVSKHQRSALPNGLICLKGGDLQEELSPFKKKAEVLELRKVFDESFFETKKIVYVSL